MMQANQKQIAERPILGARPVNFFVKDIPVYGDAILAPMDGFSDWPFRSLCNRLGSAMSYTEFVRAENIIMAYRQMWPRLRFDETERPMVFQIYGDDPDEIVKAAMMVQDKGPDIVDINMGCPAKKVAHGGAGVGLMLTPLKIARIFRRLSKQLPVPVTGKIRLGWEKCKSYKLIARIVEENGGSLIAIHGRTKEQGYGGEADWDAIAEIRQTVKIPVIGNGDVRSVADIQRLKQYTGCNAVMIGRAAIGNPWIFAGLDRHEVTNEMALEMVTEHLQRHLEFYGDYKGMLLFRKHAMQYLKLHWFPRETRIRVITETKPAVFLGLIQDIFAKYPAGIPID